MIQPRTRFNSHQPSDPVSRKRPRGLTFPEVLVAMGLAVTVLSVGATVFLAFLKEAWTHQLIAQSESLGSRMAASITAAMKTSSAWAIYPSLAIYQSDSYNNVSSEGNALVCQTKTSDGRTIPVFFSFENNQLSRAENTINNLTDTITQVSPKSGANFVFNQDNGLVSGSFEIQTPVERLSFEAYGTSLRMR